MPRSHGTSVEAASPLTTRYGNRGQDVVGGLLDVEAPGRGPGQRWNPGPRPSRIPRAISFRFSVSHPAPAQAHGSRLRLYQLSPADSGEYVCRVVSSSGPLEASVLVTIEASGSGTVLVPGKDPYGGAGRLEEGGKEGTSRPRSEASSSSLRPESMDSGV